MPRALFEKTGNAIYISHLDLMRLFQRAFQRSGLPLTHTQGFNPRPSVSIALPLSLGVESGCELLDFDLAGDKISNEEICARLNGALIAGVRVLRVYDSGQKIKNLSLLESVVTLEYDSGIPENARQQIAALFARERLVVEKKGKNGITEQDLIPMLRRISVGKGTGAACAGLLPESHIEPLAAQHCHREIPARFDAGLRALPPGRNI